MKLDRMLSHPNTRRDFTESSTDHINFFGLAFGRERKK